MRLLKRSGLGLLVVLLAGSPAASAQTSAKPASKTASKAAPKPAAAGVSGQPVKVTSVEGITEYRLAERPARPALPGPDQADDHRQHHLPGRLAPRELRRDRHGAPARAPDVQGHAQAPEHPAGADRARRAPERHRPGSTARTTSRPSRRRDENLEWALDLEADRMVNSFIAKKDLDSEMTVVRNEFERGENDPSSVLLEERVLVDGVPLAQLRQVDDRRARPTSRTCRSSACRPSTGRTTSRTTRCCSSPGKFDEAKTLALVDADLRRDPEADAHAADLLHGRADAGRRAHRHAAPRRRRPGARRGLPRPGGRAIPTSAALDVLRADPRPTRPRAASTRRSSRRRRRRRSAATSWSCTTPGFVMFGAEVRQDQIARRREGRARPDARRGRRRRADHQGGGRARARHDPEEHRPDAEQRRPRRPAVCPSTSARATGASSSSTAIASGR